MLGNPLLQRFRAVFRAVLRRSRRHSHGRKNHGINRRSQSLHGEILLRSVVNDRTPLSIHADVPVTESVMTASAFPNGPAGRVEKPAGPERSEEHTSELQSLMRTSSAVF